MSVRNLTLPATGGPVMVVDDNRTDALLTRRCFEKSSLRNEFMWVPSGSEILEYLEHVRDAEAPMPALVMLDINMPGLDGFETLRRIRAQPAFKSIPALVMFSNSSDPLDEERAVGLGADAYVQKSGDISELISFFDSLAA